MHWRPQVVGSTDSMTLTRASTIAGSEFDILLTIDSLLTEIWNVCSPDIPAFTTVQPGQIFKLEIVGSSSLHSLSYYHVTTDKSQTGLELRLATTTVRLIFLRRSHVS